MPDSTSLTRDNSTAALTARLAKYKDNAVAPNKREDPSDLPRWVKTALVFKAVDGLTYKEAAARLGKSPQSLGNYGKSPAAKKWLESLFKFIDDPVEMAKAYLRGNALSVTLERMAFLEAAIAAGDYKAGDAIAKDIQEKLGIVSPKIKSEGPAVLNITIGGGAVEIPAIEVEWEEVLDKEEKEDD